MVLFWVAEASQSHAFNNLLAGKVGKVVPPSCPLSFGGVTVTVRMDSYLFVVDCWVSWLSDVGAGGKMRR